jgi:multimeric flavodoxin WrbA
MKVVGIYGSPRKGGNSDLLLDQLLEGAASAGAQVDRIYCRKLKISGCLECGGCDDTGECVVDDDMNQVYPLLEKADVVVAATPIFFYGPTAQLKALIDRSQACWSARLLAKPDPAQRKSYDSGKGYLIAVGATKGKNLFEPSEMTAKYFYDALDMTYEGGILLRGVEGKGDISGMPRELEKAQELGRALAAG